MGLVESLSSGFSFSLTSLTGTLDGLAPDAPDVPSTSASSALQPLRGFSTDQILGSIAQVSEQGRGGLGGLPAPQTLTLPLSSQLARLDTLTNSEPGQLLTRLQAQTLADGSSDFDRVASVLGSAGSLAGDSTIGAVTQLISSLSGGALDLPGAIGPVSDGGAALVSLTGAVGTLLAVSSQGSRVAELGEQLLRLLPEQEVLECQRALSAWGDVAVLEQQIRSATPTDATQIEQLQRALAPLSVDLQRYADLASRGLGFGDAVLASGALTNASERLSAGLTRLHAYQDTAALRAFCERTAAQLESRLPASLGLGQRFDELQGALAGLVVNLGDAVNGISVDAITAPVSGALRDVTGAVRSINAAIDSVESTVLGGLTTVRDLVRGLNLQSVAEAIRTVIAPVAEAIERLDEVLGASLTAIQQAMTVAVEAIQTTKAAVVGVGETLKQPFDVIAGALNALDLPSKVQTVQGVIDEVVSALRQLRLDPYFDTAIEVMDTTASVIDAVPLDLLPDDLERDLQNAVKPIKEINFAEDVRIPLRTQLDSILERLDTDVLGQIQAKYLALVEFLQSIDPREAILKLEAETFDELLSRLNAIDPDALLEPVNNLLSEVKSVVAAIDLRSSVLADVDQVFDEIIAHAQQFNPSQLLQPVTEALNVARQKILALTKIDTWAEHLDAIVAQLESVLNRLDTAAWVPILEQQFANLVLGLRGGAGEGSVLGYLVTAVVGDPHASPAAMADVMAWLGGRADGVQQVRARLELGRDRLRATVERVEQLNPGATATAAARGYRRLRDAVRSHQGTPLGDALTPLIDASDPQTVLAAPVAYTSRYQQALARELSSLDRLTSAGLSEIDAVTNSLIEALRPLARIKQRVLGLVSEGGIDPFGKAPTDVVAELFAMVNLPGLLRTLEPLIAALKQKVLSLVRDGLVAPVKAVVAELMDFVNQLDLSALTTALDEVFTTVVDEIRSFRPSALLEEPLSAFETLQTNVANYDPLAPVRAVIVEFQAAVNEVAGPASPLRPSVILKPVLDAYAAILEDAAAIDIQRLLEPVLQEFAVITASLDSNLERSEGAFARLQGALP